MSNTAVRVNERAFFAIAGELQEGAALTLDMLGAIFGEETIATLMVRPPSPVVDDSRALEIAMKIAPSREDLFRAAAIAGLSALNPGAGGLETGDIVDFADRTVEKLRERGVL